MKCREIRDLILTDYQDGVLSEELLSQLNFHLNKCPDCKSFFDEAKVFAFAPLAKLSLNEVPSEMWSRINKKIDNVSQSESAFSLSVLKFIKSVFLKTKFYPSFSYGLGFAVLLIGLIVFSSNVFKIQNSSLGVDNLVISFIDGTEFDTNFELNSSIEFGSIVEEFFI